MIEEWPYFFSVPLFIFQKGKRFTALEVVKDGPMIGLGLLPLYRRRGDKTAQLPLLIVLGERIFHNLIESPLRTKSQTRGVTLLISSAQTFDSRGLWHEIVAGNEGIGIFAAGDGSARAIRKGNSMWQSAVAKARTWLPSNS